MMVVWDLHGALFRDAKVDQSAVGLQEANKMVPWKLASHSVYDVVEFGVAKDGFPVAEKLVGTKTFGIPRLVRIAREGHN